MPRMTARFVYGTPEWDAELARLDALHPEGFCWHCASLLDYDGDWGAHIPTEAEIDAWDTSSGAKPDAP